MNSRIPSQQMLYPLSSVQREIWFEQSLYPDTPLYNVGGYYRIDAAIVPEVFRQAVAWVVGENAVLRLALIERDGLAFQSYPEMPQIDLPVYECANENDPLQVAVSRIEQAVQRPFRLNGEALFRFALYKISENCFLWSQTYHHLVLDGWAASLVAQRVAVVYNALWCGDPVPARPGNAYIDFVENDSAYLDSASFSRHRDYWQQKFSTLPEPLLTPQAVHSNPTGLVPGAIHTWLLPRAQYEQLDALAQAHSVSTFHVLLGLFYIYFTRVCDRGECVIGLPVLNRNSPSFKQTIGLFASMIPARFGFGPETTFIELIQAIARNLRESYRHQRFPLSEINRLAGVFQAGRKRLFDLALSFEIFDQAVFFGSGAPSKAVRLNHGFEQTPLNVSVRDYCDQQDIEVDFSYNQAYFDADEIRHVEQRFRCLLDDALAHPGQAIHRLKLVPPGEQQQLLIDWNATTVALAEGCIHQQFEAQVLATPDATAVVFESERLTYAALNARANQLAHRLIALGVLPDTLVAIALERSLNMIVALLATLKAGGAYVPLDPDYPLGRLNFMLEDSGARILITQQSLRAQLPLVTEHVLCLDSEASALVRLPDSNPNQTVSPQQLAYVIYTSGSTGRPKGAMNTQGAIFNRLVWMQSVFQLDASDCVLQKTPSSFDVSVWEFFWPLMTGARLVFARPGGHRDNDYLSELIRKEQITTVHFVPPMLQAFIETAQACTSLRRVICSGQELTVSTLPPFFKALPNCELHNLYGPTEAAVDVTWFPCSPQAAQLNRIPIGRPISNTRLYVLDRHGNPVPIGVPGELHIGGLCLARGYLNRPELTAERFIPDVFGTEPDSRLYKTGDLVRYRSDGQIEFLGRLDHQVKIRGFRIELGEIEAALLTHSALRDVIVIARPDATGANRLLAYLVAKASSEVPSVHELREHLQSTLPDTMIPAVFIPLDTLPLTPNGKVDRRALSEPDITPDSEEQTAPRDALEEIVAGLWASVLNRPVIGIHANFFELGGHSLLATQLASRLRDALGITVPLRWLFEAPTVLLLTERIRPVLAGEGGETEESETPGRDAAERIIPRVPREQPLPLSFAQQRLWFLDQLEGSNAIYNMPGVLDLSGALDIEALRFALSEIVRRHEALRTCLVAKDGAPVQVITPARPLSLPVIDLRRCADPEVEAQRLAREEAELPFDLACDIPLRTQLLQRHESAWTLLLTLHHSAADGWSVTLMIRELVALYGAFHSGQPSPLPELPIQYADYACWQRHYLSGARREQQLTHWRTRLAGIPDCLNLPTDRPRPPRQSYRGEAIDFTVDAESTEALRRLSRRNGVTLYMTLLAAWAILLGRHSGDDDIVIGSPVANRTQSAIEPLIGFFVNTLALRADLSGRPSVLELLARIRQTCLDAYAHQEIPFESLVETLGVARHLGHAPIFQVLFVLQNTEHQNLTLPDLDIHLEKSESRVAKFDLTLSITEQEGSQEGTLAGTLEYATDLFDRETIERMSAQYTTLLRALVAHPEQTIDRLDLLPDSERQQLLFDWNATAAAVPEGCVHHRIEAQARATPEATALVFGDECLSYGELNGRANRLAHYLIELGVLADAPVGIALERSPDMIVALLAVLKAGGAYVPLDPDYPAERLAFMRQDSGARIVITRSGLQQTGLQGSEYWLCLDSDGPTIARYPDTNPSPNPPIAPEHLAYIIYTSGSTGKPKGVALTHGGLSNLAQAQIKSFDVTPTSRVAQFASFSFDVSVSETVMALCAGAALYLPDAEERLPGEPLWRYLDQSAISHLSLTPTALAVLPPSHLPCLKHLIVGGEPCPLTLAAFWSQGRRFYNAYGPTEATVCASLAEFSECAAFDTLAALPIGRPVANTRLYVLDRNANPVPIGVPGELYIGGMGLARGYLNRPELTAERFIPDVFGTEPGSRLYKTGDLVRYRSDGQIEFLGRLDHQVKIRGFRIELGEIEAALLTHPALRYVIVIARPDATGANRLLAYLVAKASSEVPSVHELREHLQATLPDTMIPAAFIPLDTLPLTPNGKVDRRALPEPDQSPDSEGQAAPRDALEEIVAGLWASVLNRPVIGVHANFFELGGHSLLATQLASRLRDALDTPIPVRWLFENPTVAELSQHIRSGQVGMHGPALIPDNRIVPGTTRITPDLLPLVTLTQGEIELALCGVEGGVRNVQDIYPLAPLQQGILFHHQLQGEGARDAYLNHVLLSFDTPARRQAFVGALQSVIDRHDILRTAFVWDQLPEPVQVVWRRAALAVETVLFDPAGGPAPIAEQLESFRSRLAVLDLNRAPLLRIVLADDGERSLLFFVFHHLIMDHTTLEVMLEEIAAHLQGRADELPPPVPFRHFVAQSRGGFSAEAHEAFFRAMLGDIETPTAPFGLLDVQGDGSAIVEARSVLPPELARRLRQQVRRLGATPASLYHLAWALVLSRFCGQDKVVFGTVLFGRMQGGEGIERALGLFINTLPLRIDCDARPVAEALKDTQRGILALMRHEHASLSLAQRCSAVPATVPLFSALLNYRHSSSSDTPGHALEGIDVLQVEDRTNYPLCLSVDDLGEGFALTVQVDASVDAPRIGAFLQRTLEALVDALEQAPQTALCQLDILPPQERKKLLFDWNDTAMPLPETGVHRLFEAQVIRTPEDTALVFADESLSYAELNARANRLAHRLIELGVKADTPVAIALERSTAMIVALLATLKAGGAYVPLDPDYPAERLAFMLADCAAKILITADGLHSKRRLAAEHVLCLDTESLASQPDGNPDRPVNPEQLAYVIYTSGSTGKPKGVAMPHLPLCNLIAWQLQNTPEILAKPKGVALTHGGLSNLAQAQIKSFDVTPTSRVAQFASFSFDASVSETVMALCAGAALYLPDAEERLPGEPLWRYLDQSAISHLTLPPTALAALPHSPLSRLSSLIVAGEPCPLTLAAFWSQGRRFYNAYGPTEATVCATIAELASTDIKAVSALPIGRPVANTRLYVLDRYANPVPIGVPGELHIGGMGLARGYLNRPELTAERFIPDVFGTEPGSRLYKTGDLVRYRSDGQLEFLGRLDHQVKIRGFRIELGEIEAALLTHPALRDVIVIARADATGANCLLAYLVAKASSEVPSVHELREHLQATLPDTMIPAVFISLDTLPLTPNGKVDRRALPEPDQSPDSEGQTAPRDALEEIVAGLWASVLNRPVIGVHANFFELGGHSLLAVRLVAEIEKRFGQRVPVSRLFEFPTVAGIATVLRQNGEIPEASCLVRIRAQGTRPPLFFVPGAGGMVNYLYPLAQSLNAEIPFFAFQAQGLDGNSLPYVNIEAVAEHYVDLLCQAQPHGPYFLAGHSFGGLVAFAMAQVLLARGQAIGLLAILDAHAPGVISDVEEDQSILDVGNLLRQAFGEEMLPDRDEWSDLDTEAQLSCFAGRLEAANLLPQGGGADHLRRLLTVYQANLHMIRQYLPEASHGIPIVLFRASEAIAGQVLNSVEEEDLGWGRYSACPVSVQYVSGDHVSMMKPPHVRALAHALGLRL